MNGCVLFHDARVSNSIGYYAVCIYNGLLWLRRERFDATGGRCVFSVEKKAFNASYVNQHHYNNVYQANMSDVACIFEILHVDLMLEDKRCIER